MSVTLVSDPTEEGFNSFVSVAQADEYFSGMYFPGDAPTTWDDFEDDEKAQLLITASRKLSALNWTGVPYETTQVLAFPRSYTWYEYGGTVDLGDNGLPNWLVPLVCEYARYIWEDAKLAKTSASLGLFKSVSVGPISVTLRDGSETTFPISVMSLLGPLSPTYVLLGGKVRSMSITY